MNLLSWFVGRWWFWVIFVGLAFGVPLGRSLRMPTPSLPPVLDQIEPFVLLDQNGSPYGLEQLRDKVWVADLAAGELTPQPALEELEKRMRKLGDAFHLVTFAMPPPGMDASSFGPRLLAFARSQHANPRRWTFVTGAPARLGPPLGRLKLARGEAKLALVDGRGRLRGLYEVADKASMEELIFDAALLVNHY